MSFQYVHRYLVELNVFLTPNVPLRFFKSFVFRVNFNAMSIGSTAEWAWRKVNCNPTLYSVKNSLKIYSIVCIR